MAIINEIYLEIWPKIVIIQKAAMPPLIASLAHPFIDLQSMNRRPRVLVLLLNLQNNVEANY